MFWFFFLTKVRTWMKLLFFSAKNKYSILEQIEKVKKMKDWFHKTAAGGSIYG